LLVKRLGQVRTLVGIQVTGLPFLTLMGISPNQWFAGAGYILREVFTGIGAGPTGGMGAPVERLFPMEIVKQHERGTTNGLMHAFLEFPMSIGASIAGPMMVRREWSQIYLLAGAWFAASYLTFLCFFLPVETGLRRTAAVRREG
jgi:MFS family permease